MVAPVAAPRAGGPAVTLVRTVSTPRYLEERQTGSEASTASDKLAALAAVAARVILSPALLLRSLLAAPDMVVWNEPCGYRSPGWRQWAAQAAGKGTSVRRATARAIGATVGRAVAMEHAVEADVRVVLRRFWESSRTSLMLTVQAALYYASLHVLWFFGVHHLIFHFKSDLEWAVCALSGTFHVTAAGEKVQYTLLSAMDPDYPTPYGPASFPWGPALDDARNAHFLALACKAVYEDERIVRDLVEGAWGLKLLHYSRVPAHWTAEYWVPDLVWFAARVPASGAVIVAFKGADPLWQVSLKADPPISKRERTGLVGQVHCGLWRGLKQAAPGAPAGTSIWDTIVSVLRRVPPGPSGRPAPVWLAGHSLGGGLAALTAALLQSRCPDLAPRLSAVFTYAAPRFGDAAFAASFDAAFAGRAFRYVNGSDMVCKLPPGWGYAHPAAERFITSAPVPRSGRGATPAAARSSSGRILRAEDDPAGVAAAAVREDRWGYWYSLRKLVRGGAEDATTTTASTTAAAASSAAAAAGAATAAAAAAPPPVPIPPERATRRVARALLFAMPGFSDHFLCDYERALREELPAAMAADAGRAASPRREAGGASAGAAGVAPVVSAVDAAAAAAAAAASARRRFGGAGADRRCSAEAETPTGFAPSSPFAVVQVAPGLAAAAGGADAWDEARSAEEERPAATTSNKDGGTPAVPAVSLTAIAAAVGVAALPRQPSLSPGRPPRAPRPHDLPFDCLEQVAVTLCLDGGDGAWPVAQRGGGDACGGASARPVAPPPSNPAALAHLAATCTALRAACHSALARLTHLDLTPQRIVPLIPRGRPLSSGGGGGGGASTSTSTTRPPPTPAELAAAAPLFPALLSRCTAAVSVDLSRGHAYVTDAALDALGAAAGGTLRQLRAAHCTRLTAPALARLAAAAPHVTTLSLAGVPAAGEPGALDGFTAVEDLDVAWVRAFCGSSGGGGGHSHRRPLTRAALRGCEGVGDAAVAAICSPVLTFLDLAFTAVSDAGLAAVAAGAPALRTLVVANSERCDEIWSTGFFSAGGLRRFRAAAPGVEVVLVAS